MSSFSSVVRKGPKVAPRVAPRRNVVRRATAPQSKGPAHIGSNTFAGVSPPSPPTTGEDADTQPLSTLRDSTTPLGQQSAPGYENQTSTVSAESSRPTSTSQDPAFEFSTSEQALVTTNVQDTPVNSELQTASEPSLATTYVEENGFTNHESRDSQQPVARSNIERDGQLQEESEVANNNHDAVQAAQAVREHISTSTRNSAAQTHSRQSRKRKQPPRAGANIILSQPSVPAYPASTPDQNVAPTGSQERSRVASRTPSISSQHSNAQLPTPRNEFDRISSQLQTIQDASAAINARTLSTNRNAHRATATPMPTASGTEEELTGQTSTGRPTKRRRTDCDRPRTATEQAADVIANVMGTNVTSAEPTKKRPRGATPENAEEHEITPEITKMGDLCKDRKWGKKSETEKEMAANWDEILRRRKEDAEERLALAQSGSRRKRDKGQTLQNGAGPAASLTLRIEDGNIVAGDRTIDRHAQLDTIIEQTNEADIREDKDIYKRVLATTVGCRNPIAPGQTWDDLSTELFYTGLKKFGTDFQMISATIPGKTRKQVKLKYNVEERKDWARVKRCLGMKEEVNLDEYAEAAKVAFATVADVYKQMEEDEKRLREEDEQRRRDEGIIPQNQDRDTGADGDGEADVALPSIEGGAEAAAREVVEAALGVDRQSTTSRVGSTTTARQTAQPSGKRKQTAKKSASVSKKGRQVAGKNKGFEGVEERIGGIEEVAMPGA